MHPSVSEAVLLELCTGKIILGGEWGVIKIILGGGFRCALPPGLIGGIVWGFLPPVNKVFVMV